MIFSQEKETVLKDLDPDHPEFMACSKLFSYENNGYFNDIHFMKLNII
jgi:hypothetical protein